MNPNDYQKLASRTECDQNTSASRMVVRNYGGEIPIRSLIPIRLNHAIMGLAGETGELASILLKWVYYGKNFSQEELRLKVAEELGDALWFIAEACNALGLNLADVMEANIAKLRARYPDRFTEELCADDNRDSPREMMAIVNKLGQTVEPLTQPKESDKIEGSLEITNNLTHCNHQWVWMNANKLFRCGLCGKTNE